MGLSALLFSCTQNKDNSKGLLLKNITIVDIVTGELHPNRYVVIKNNVIHSIDTVNKKESGIEIIDCKDKYLIPGLINMHVHLFNNVSLRAPNEWAFPLFVRNGVTGVREMWTPLDSMHTIERWRDELSLGKEVPRILAAGGLIEGGSNPWMSNMHIISTEAEGRNFVRNIKESGHDFVKVYSHLAPNVYMAIIDEANSLDLEVSGHIPLEVRLIDALVRGHRTNEHLHQVNIACTTEEERFLIERKQLYEGTYALEDEYKLLDRQTLQVVDFYNDSICVEVAKLIADTEQWQVPTLINEKRWFLGVNANQTMDSLLESLPKEVKDRWIRSMEHGDVTYSGDSLSLIRGWNTYKKIVKTLADNNVGFLAGTDFGAPFIYPGYSLHQEMELFVELGLTPLQALQTATLNPAKYLQLTDSLGTVQEGKIADLVILEKNPLEDISNTQQINGVILNGKYIHKSAFQKLIKQIE